MSIVGLMFEKSSAGVVRLTPIETHCGYVI